eukprot:scaffold33464_cov18-Prasinocladus_malaysianus.AAC.1
MFILVEAYQSKAANPTTSVNGSVATTVVHSYRCANRNAVRLPTYGPPGYQQLFIFRSDGDCYIQNDLKRLSAALGFVIRRVCIILMCIAAICHASKTTTITTDDK